MPTLGGRYRLDDRIGTGGMAEVWRGYDLVLERTVAVKMLAADLATDPRAGARVRAEALAAARLTHPHVAAVYDFGQSRRGLRIGNPYIVMEFVHGETLQERLRRHGPLPWRTTATVCAQVAAALAAAHEQGMVHRDVKPGNVMLTATGVKVVDFGIAAAIGQAQTDTGEIVLGTPLYMAPEQLRGDPVVPASDLYALGLLLYECLTGRPPWPDGSPADIALARADHLLPAPLPPIAGLPDTLAQLCRRCLDDAADERPTAQQAATLLAGTTDAEPATVYPAPPGTAVTPRPPLPADPADTGRFRAVTVAGGRDIRALADSAERAAGSVEKPVQPRRTWRPPRTLTSAAVATAVTAALAAMSVARLPTGWSLGSLTGSGASARGDGTARCTTRYAAREHRDGSFTAVLTVTNTGDDTLEEWSLTFVLPAGQRLTMAPGTRWTRTGAEVTLRGGAALTAGAAATLALAGTYADSGGIPTGFALDGIGCRQENTVVGSAGAPGTATQGGSAASGTPAGSPTTDPRPSKPGSAAPSPIPSTALTHPAGARPSPSVEPSGVAPTPGAEASARTGPDPTSPPPVVAGPSASASTRPATSGPDGAGAPDLP